MLDSTGKVPSGILHGNLNQFGDYDQCTGISTKIKLGNNQKNLLNIQGKYCLIHLDIESTSSDMDIPLNMAQGRTLIKSTYNDVCIQKKKETFEYYCYSEKVRKLTTFLPLNAFL